MHLLLIPRGMNMLECDWELNKQLQFHRFQYKDLYTCCLCTPSYESIHYCLYIPVGNQWKGFHGGLEYIHKMLDLHEFYNLHLFHMGMENKGFSELLEELKKFDININDFHK